jgi:hypothetical protein
MSARWRRRSALLPFFETCDKILFGNGGGDGTGKTFDLVWHSQYGSAFSTVWHDVILGVLAWDGAVLQ